MSHPLIGPADEIAETIEELGHTLRPEARARLSREVAAAIRLELLRLGYDGIVARDAGGDGIDYVVAIARETAKVVIQL